MNRKDMVWVWTGKRSPATLKDWDKTEAKQIVEAAIANTTKLKEAVSRIQVKAGRVYLFHLYEPNAPEGTQFTVPLIDGKYLEFTLARITIYDKSKSFCNCSLDWQRPNNEWMTVDSGSLAECIQIAEKSDWFQV
ncbi:MAG: hypothetical protein LBR10_09490 [Prevotellaceae bacterium]|jgi:hypothetical protein|nr:hypothetical protein [Prevotellaceae bacterium]